MTELCDYASIFLVRKSKGRYHSTDLGLDGRIVLKSIYRIQNGSGAHPSSYTMDTRGSFPGGEAAGA
jgi:hypothetical protein